MRSSSAWTAARCVARLGEGLVGDLAEGLLPRVAAAHLGREREVEAHDRRAVRRRLVEAREVVGREEVEAGRRRAAAELGEEGVAGVGGEGRAHAGQGKGSGGRAEGEMRGASRRERGRAAVTALGVRERVAGVRVDGRVVAGGVGVGAHALEQAGAGGVDVLGRVLERLVEDAGDLGERQVELVVEERGVVGAREAVGLRVVGERVGVASRPSVGPSGLSSSSVSVRRALLDGVGVGRDRARARGRRR